MKARLQTGSLDDPETTLVHARLIREKPFLRRFYEQCYKFMESQLAAAPRGAVLELGSGGGFFREYVPAAIRSDIVPLPFVDAVCSAQQLPFRSSSLAAICMLDVLHHLPDVRCFFSEASRCLASEGRVVMIEPSATPLAKFIYTHWHHEDFAPDAEDWQFPAGGRLSTANTALPWLVFFRDRDKFHQEFPRLQLLAAEPFCPLLYLLSGGMSGPQFLPSMSLGLISGLERLLAPCNPWLGLFFKLVLQKR